MIGPSFSVFYYLLSFLFSYVGSFCALFVVYLIQRAVVKCWPRESHARRPLRAYLACYTVIVLWRLIQSFIFSYLYEYYKRTQDFTPMMIRSYVMAALALIGFFGWIVLFIRMWRQRAWRRKQIQTLHPARFQFGLHDLFIGSIALGVSLTVLNASLPEQNKTSILAAVFSLLSACGTFASLLDVFRFAPAMNTSRWRLLLLGVLPIISSRYVFVFAVFTTWLAWRQTMLDAAIHTHEKRRITLTDSPQDQMVRD